MLHKSNLHSYQATAVTHILDHPRSALFLDLGLGKTVVTLSAITELFDKGVTGGVLIVAPLRVCQTVWSQEAKKWAHTRHLTFSLIHGSPKHRKWALGKHKHCYLINYEGLEWLQNELVIRYLSKGKPLPFDTIVLDELTKMKSVRNPNTLDPPGSTRGGALLKFLPYLGRRIGLTGTPSPNGMKDLMGQFLCIDDGMRLGNSMQVFQERFFNSSGYGGYSFEITEEGAATIPALISDITLEMKGSDYLTNLPKIIENEIMVPLNKKNQATYDNMERSLWATLDSGATIEAVNALVLINKCLQITGGSVYLEPGLPEWELIHKQKLDALEDLYYDNGQKPLLVAYQYQHERDRIVKRFKKQKVTVMSGKMTTAEVKQTVLDWNVGKIDILIGHKASISHGMNLQMGSNHVVLYGLDYNLELYLQFIGRLARQGQPEDHVFVHKLLCPNTLDMVVNEALAHKEEEQIGLRRALKEYRLQRKV